MPLNSSTQRPISSATWHPTEDPRILYKRRWVGIPGFLLVFLAGAVSSLKTTPLYEASAQLMIEKDARRATSLDSVLQDCASWSEDSFYPTQYRILQSRQLASRTVSELERLGTVEREPTRRTSLNPTALVTSALTSLKGVFLSAPPPAAAAGATRTGPAPAVDAVRSGKTDAFLGSLLVVPVRTSSLVDLKFRSPDPEYAARAANTLAEQYIQHSLESRFSASKEMNDWLGTQLEGQRAKVEASDRALQEFKERHNAVAFDDKQNIVVQKLTSLNQQLIEAKIQRLDKEQQFNVLSDLRSRSAPLDSYPAVMASDVVQKLKVDLLDKQSRQDELRKQGFGDAYPQLRALTTQVEEIRRRLTAEIDNVADAVRADYQAAKQKEDALAAALETQKGESLGLDRTGMLYAALEREADSNRQLYQNLLQRTKETGVSNDFKGTNIQVVDKAEVPLWPVLPNAPRDLALAAFGGILLGLGLAFGVEYFDSRIKSPEEIKTHLGIPFLGIIPIAPGTERTPEAPMLSDQVPPAFAESIRALRTAVVFSSADEGARSIVVTSTGPTEGKTVVSSSLAITLAQVGLRTLVVDADLRRPRLHDALGRPQEPGLSNVLVGEIDLVAALRPTSVPNLTILAAGHIPPNPAELLGSPKYLLLLDELKKRYDWIVIDAPPVMPVTDAAIVARSSSGVLFVIGSEMTPRQSAMTAIEQLRSSGAKFIGGVLNRVNIYKHSYYYAPYYRKEYAKYYQRSPNRA